MVKCMETEKFKWSGRGGGLHFDNQNQSNIHNQGCQIHTKMRFKYRKKDKVVRKKTSKQKLVECREIQQI